MIFWICIRGYSDELIPIRGDIFLTVYGGSAYPGSWLIWVVRDFWQKFQSRKPEMARGPWWWYLPNMVFHLCLLISGWLITLALNALFCPRIITIIIIIMIIIIIIIYMLMREAKTLYPFLRKLHGRRSVKFGTIMVYIEKECRMLIFKNNAYNNHN